MTTASWTGPLLGDRFEVGELLGVGSSAAVFLATDRVTGDQVAVKIGHAQTGTEGREDFAREATVAQRLDHPNVARVHAHGWHDSAGLVQPWLAMDLLTGPSLAAWVAEHGPLAPGPAGIAIGQVLEALAAAHALGLVHRDVAPDNVLLDGEGRLRLVDFGLASVTGVPATSPGSAGQVVGHVHYMSPEQASGRPVGAAGDLYQAGALLYFLLTGEPPYVRAAVADVLRAHVEAPVPVPSARDPRNRPLDLVVTTALAKDPARRFASAVAMGQAVARSTAPGRDGARVPGSDDATQVVALDAGTTVTPVWQHRTPATVDDGFRESRFGGIGWLVGAAVALVVALVWGLAGGDTPVAVAESRADAATTAPPSPLAATTQPTAPPVDDRVAVPVLDGPLAAVETRLRSSGLTVGTITRVSSPELSGTVVGGSVSSGTRVEPGTPVDLQVASGSNVVPDVAGRSPGEARALLEAAGFVPVVMSSSGSSSGVTVVGTQPGAGTVLRLGVSVTVETFSAPSGVDPGTDGSGTGESGDA